MLHSKEKEDKNILALLYSIKPILGFIRKFL